MQMGLWLTFLELSLVLDYALVHEKEQILSGGGKNLTGLWKVG